MTLNNQIEVHKTEVCPICGLHVAKPCLKDHLESHDVTTSYKNGLVTKTKTKSKKRKLTETQGDPVQPRLNSYLVYCRAFRETKKQQFPQLDMIGINQKLREDWHKLITAEKEAFKPTSTAEEIAPTAPTVPAPTRADIERGQMTILKCNACGRMFLNKDALDTHIREHHIVVENTVAANELDIVEVAGSGVTEDAPVEVNHEASDILEEAANEITEDVLPEPVQKKVKNINTKCV